MEQGRHGWNSEVEGQLRAIGLDPGSVRVGVATSDATGILASPHSFIRRDDCTHRVIAELVAEYEADVVVVGLPLGLSGKRGAAAQAAQAEAEALTQLLEIPVLLHDERLTTVSAHRALAEGGSNSRSRRAKVDASAAAVMLQSWLDSPQGRRYRAERSH